MIIHKHFILALRSVFSNKEILLNFDVIFIKYRDPIRKNIFILRIPCTSWTTVLSATKKRSVEEYKANETDPSANPGEPYCSAFKSRFGTSRNYIQNTWISRYANYWYVLCLKYCFWWHCLYLVIISLCSISFYVINTSWINVEGLVYRNMNWECCIYIYMFMTIQNNTFGPKTIKLKRQTRMNLSL